MQHETGEIILVEDGSTDASLQICKELSSKHKIVKVFTHAGNANKGAGASRNLGIKKAALEYLAFLDADDYYLPGRFRAEREIFVEKPLTDGVYGALGFDYYTTAGKEKYKNLGYGDLTTVSGKIPANQLFLVMVGLHEKYHGYFHINTLTIKKVALLNKTPLFNDLSLHEDTVFFVQLSLTCRLEAGIVDEPIGMRGVHDNNRIVNRPVKSNRLVLQWNSLYDWAKKTGRNPGLTTLFRNFLIREKIFYSNRPGAFLQLLWFSSSKKSFISERMFFNPCCLYVFGKNYGNYMIVLKERIFAKTFGSTYAPSTHLLKSIHPFGTE